MAVSIIDAQRQTLLSTIKQITRDDWKVLILDPDSRRLVDNVLEQDAILNENITNIEQITDRRPANHDVDALYLLTPHPHIVDCVMADFEKRKYRKAHLVWTSLLSPSLRDRLDKSRIAREQIATFKVLNTDFYPRESHLVTFRDPWSFPILYHPGCNSLVRQHMENMAQKIVGVCVTLGEYPVIRYYRPRAPTHEASILCSHLARFVQDELDLYAKFHEDFPPPSSRPRGVLYVCDRSMDLFAPLLHEFTYQAMAFDLLPIKDGDKTTYRTIVNEGQPDEKEKDVEISEKDKIWTENRHRHMKDTIEKLMNDFQKFINDNPNFTKSGDATSLNAIKDMLAGLPQFQELKEAYSLHLSMAQESMNRFQKYKLPDLASVEQILATGLDEDYKKPKNLADQVVRMLDEEAVSPPDRLRLLILYLLYKDGLVPSDLDKLLAHAQLPPQNGDALRNLEMLGARIARTIKESTPIPPPMFPPKPPPPSLSDEYSLSRFEPVLANMLSAHAANTLDANIFPYTRPPLDFDSDPTSALKNQQPSATSLRAAKPTWAKTRANNIGLELRQRVIVFMAGGATYSEARTCYDVSRTTNREIFLVTSHMLTPHLFVRQINDLSTDPRRLAIPANQPKPQAPRHLFEPEPGEQPARSAPAQGAGAAGPQGARQPGAPGLSKAMGAMGLNGRPAQQQQGNGPSQPASANSSAKISRDSQGSAMSGSAAGGGEKKKMKHHFGFGKKS